MAEASINLFFILLERRHSTSRSLRFHDFADVNRLRLLKEIMDRDPHFDTQANRRSIERQLRRHRRRFRHGRRWDWNHRNMVARGVYVARLLERQGGDRVREERILAFVQEMHPYVHAGWRAMYDGLERGNKLGVLRPRMRSKRARELVGSPAVVASMILVDAMLLAQDAVSVGSFGEKLDRLGQRNREVAGLS